uniref:Ig-like domain-containing protein n=1 Tax=Strigamia maritima TaxID=126957 RepID=T1IWH4_STRMM
MKRNLRPNDLSVGLELQPQFEINVAALNRQNTVSWVRHQDLHILTVGRYTYISDQRFQAYHLATADDWTLQIRYTQLKDAGAYECQVSTEPKMSLVITLNVVGKCLRNEPLARCCASGLFCAKLVQLGLNISSLVVIGDAVLPQTQTIRTTL